MSPVVAMRKLPDDEMLGQIAGWIKEKAENSRVLEITPTVANAILARYNKGNRPPKPGKIAKYAAAMKAGEWRLTGDTIKFSDLGRLSDGQNRLIACAEAKVPFRTHVVFGIEDDVFDVLDRGKNRTPGDALAIAYPGLTNANTAANAVRWIKLFESGRVKERTTFEPTEILGFYEGYNKKLLDEAVRKAGEVYRANNQNPRGLMAALYYLFSQKDQELARRFMEALSTGSFAGRAKPLRKAATELAKLHEASDGRVHDVVRAAMWVNAWNLFVSKRVGHNNRVRWDTKADFPAIQG